MNANDAGPQLPSASATPPNYGSTAQSPTAPGYPDTGANAYQPASYAGPPAGYGSPPSGGMPNAAASGAYAAPPNSAPSNAGPSYTAPSAAAPQTGPYNESYGPPAAAGNGYGSGGVAGYQTPSAQPPAYPPPDPYGQTAPAQNPAYPATADPYASAVPAAGAAAQAYSTPPAGNAYDNGSAGYPTADYGNQVDRYATPPIQTEQAAADRYSVTSNEPSGQSPPETPQAASGTAPYQPGVTGYSPGNTGYSPPGVAPYQMPAQPNVTSAPRRDPYFRPGGTSDYLPGGGGASPAAPAAATDPYAPPAGSYQTPTGY